MLRHVLAHNGGREQAVVNHLVSLVRPGGAVCLVDVERTAIRWYPVEDAAVLADINERYRQFHAGLGNDLFVGLRLGELLDAPPPPEVLGALLGLAAAPLLAVAALADPLPGFVHVHPPGPLRFRRRGGCP